MKKIFSLLLVLILFVSLCSCSSSDLASIKKEGVLLVGVTVYEPMDYRDTEGNWVGFDAELAELAAKKLGVKVVFVIFNWDE